MAEDKRFDSQSAYTLHNFNQNSQPAPRPVQPQCPACGLVVAADTRYCPNDSTPIEGAGLARSITNYQFIRLIGEGGMANVYEAEHVVLKKRVAIKVLKAHLTETSAFMRFQQEAQTASRLKHPNVVAVHDCGISESNEPYMIMELVTGRTLDNLLKNGPLSIPESLEIIKQISKGVLAAHEKGILHRDLKPSNVMIETQGSITTARVLDFGIAKIIQDAEKNSLKTRTGELFGTPTYMSPEQIAGENLDQRSDIFAIGCILYEMLTGQPPVVGNNAIEIMFKQVNEKPQSLSEASLGQKFPVQLEKIVSCAIAKTAANRFAALEQFLTAIENFQDGKSVGFDNKAENTSLLKKTKSRSKPILFLGLAIFFIGLIAATIFGVLKADEPEKIQIKSSQPVRESNSVLSDVLNSESSIADFDYGNGLTRMGGVEDLTVPSNIHDGPLANLEHFKLLRKLKLKECTLLTPKCLNYLLQLPNFKVLDLSDTHLCTKEAMQKISQMKHLTRLEISGNTSVPDALPDLTGPTGLEELAIKDTDVSDHVIRHLAQFKNLKKLELDKSLNLTDEGVEEAGKISSLEELKLNHCFHLDDNVGLPLSKFKNLKRIELSDTPASDKTLRQLSNVPRLTYVDVRRCANVSDDGAERFRKANPTCLLLNRDGQTRVKKSFQTDL